MATLIISNYSVPKPITGKINGQSRTILVQPGSQVFTETIFDTLPDVNLIITPITDPVIFPAISQSASGGGASSVDREFVVSTYTVKNAFTGASVGDTITCTQVIDVSSTPSTVSTIWRNQTTAADLGSVPVAANLTLVGSQALTDGQLRVSRCH